MPDDEISWIDVDLKLAILQILVAALRANAKNGGKTTTDLCSILVNTDKEDIKLALYWLRGQRFVVFGEGQYLITALGVDFLLEQIPLPDRLREDVKQNRQSGWWPPPPNNPTDSSGVRRKPRPASGAGEIALPLPNPPVDG